MKLLPSEIEKTQKIVEMLKQRIIMVKLEFLYDLEKEEITIQKFNKLGYNFHDGKITSFRGILVQS